MDRSRIKKIVPVILAGGSGTRLWPLSRKNYPKQFLKLIGNRSLFQETLLRIKQIAHVKESLIVTNESHYFICQDQMKEIQMEHVKFVLEPCSRNTAPAIGLAAEYIREFFGEEALMLVLPADHLIGNSSAFAKTIESAYDTADLGLFVTFGVVPTSPKTGYGYIQAGEAVSSQGFTVQSFVEKPDHQTAEQFLAAQNYYWNSGLFLIQAKAYLEELKKQAPAIFFPVKQAFEASDQKEDYFRADSEAFAKSPSDSIDYAVMEKLERAVVIPLKLPWSDLGCWASVADAGETDEKNNVIRGNVIMKNCEGCLLSSENEPLVATIGIKDQIVVSTPDAVLVADKAYAQEVKEIVNGLKNTNNTLTTHHKKVHAPWGYYETLVKQADFHIKHLVVNPGARLTMSGGRFMTIIRGAIEATVLEDSSLLKKNTSLFLPQDNELFNPGTKPTHILEVCVQSNSARIEESIRTLEELLKTKVS